MVDLTATLLPVRIVQAVFAIVVLGTLGDAASDWDRWFFGGAPSQVAFLIFCACWTLLVLAYFILAPIFVPVAAHRFAILAVEAVTMIFWFAGFIALAAGLGDWCPQAFTSCKTAAAGDAFSAFEWVLFVYTLVVAAIAAFGSGRGGKVSAETAAPAMTVP